MNFICDGAISRADKIVRWRNRGGATRKRVAQFLLVLLFPSISRLKCKCAMGFTLGIAL